MANFLDFEQMERRGCGDASNLRRTWGRHLKLVRKLAAIDPGGVLREINGAVAEGIDRGYVPFAKREARERVRELLGGEPRNRDPETAEVLRRLNDWRGPGASKDAGC